MAVGDARFQRKSKEAFQSRLPTSRIVMVSHSMPALLEYCTSGLILDAGNVQYFDDLGEAIERYGELNA